MLCLTACNEFTEGFTSGFVNGFSKTFQQESTRSDDTKINRLDDYLRYLSGEQSYELGTPIDCASIKKDYIEIFNELVKSDPQIPVGELWYYPNSDLLVLNVGLGTATQQEMDSAVADVPHFIRMGAKSRGEIEEEYLYFASMVRLFSRYEVWYRDKSAEFDLSAYPKCNPYTERPS